MEKIPTIFVRDWEGNRKVLPESALPDFDFSRAVATEKLDGMNVRVTVRNGTAVRLEKRRNPSKAQKTAGIRDPWYVDAAPSSPEDQYLFEALAHTDLTEVPDGEWSAEALGPKIQGNPLRLEHHTLFFFSLPEWRERIVFQEVPLEFEALKSWLAEQKSLFGNDCLIEGLVWHDPHSGRMCKIKRKDFA